MEKVPDCYLESVEEQGVGADQPLGTGFAACLGLAAVAAEDAEPVARGTLAQVLLDLAQSVAVLPALVLRGFPLELPGNLVALVRLAVLAELGLRAVLVQWGKPDQVDLAAK